MWNYLVFATVVGALRLFNFMPLQWRLAFAETGIRCYALLRPRFVSVCRKNMSVVFPHARPEEIQQMLRASYRSLARFIVDTARFHLLTEEWVRAHIDCPFAKEYLAIKQRVPGKGILTASGHLGSIELQALAAPFVGRTFSFVARSLKQPLLDRWWLKNRQLRGNRVIPRKGAVAQVIKNLQEGIDVAILIDQNVKREHAVFVDWFGVPAATTFALGHAAVATRCPVVVSAICYVGDEKYRVEEHEVNVTPIYDNEQLSSEEKALAITTLVSKELQSLILTHPTEWFWMHRRWKTRPVGEPENFYG